MSYVIAVETLSAQSAAVIRARVSREEIPAFLISAFPEIVGLMQAQGVPIAGPPFARYGMGEQEFDVTAGFPVDGAVRPAGRVEVGQLPGGDVANTIHTGSYEGLPDAFHAIVEWIGTNGRQIAADPWESYLDGPEVAEPRTQVFFPLVTA